MAWVLIQVLVCALTVALSLPAFGHEPGQPVAGSGKWIPLSPKLR
jgi:hypothetical protein